MFSVFSGVSNAKEVGEDGEITGRPVRTTFYRDGKEVKDGRYIAPSVRSAGKEGLSPEQALQRPIAAGGRSMGALKPVRAWLPIVSTATSAAATALSSTITIVPANAQDWASFAALYDEVRIIRGIAYVTFYSTTAAAVTNVPCTSIVVFDPADGVALATVNDALTYAQHLGPLLVASPEQPAAAGGTIRVSPASMCKTGYHTFGFHPLKGTRSLRNTANATWVFGDWSATTDAADICGFLKVYITAPATGTVSYLMWAKYEMEFRSRR